LHDNAPAQWAPATQKKLAYLGFQCLDHPPYSLDMAPSDYHLFPGLKKQLKGRHFSSDTEVTAAAELQKVQQQAKKCIELRGEYAE
jgi:histone-lysine N-methyltransferase SETMAR